MNSLLGYDKLIYIILRYAQERKKMKKSLKIALICLIVAIMITTIVLINFTELGVVKLNKLNGNRGMFDTKFGFTADEAYATMYIMRDVGIRQHLIIHLLDYVFIMSYFILMTIAALPFLKSKFQLLAVLVPMGLVFADLIENITMDVAFIKYPQRMNSLVNTSNVFGWIKWSMLVVWVAFFITIVTLWFLEKRKAKLSTAAQIAESKEV